MTELSEPAPTTAILGLPLVTEQDILGLQSGERLISPPDNLQPEIPNATTTGVASNFHQFFGSNNRLFAIFWELPCAQRFEQMYPDLKKDVDRIVDSSNNSLTKEIDPSDRAKLEEAYRVIRSLIDRNDPEQKLLEGIFLSK